VLLALPLPLTGAWRSPQRSLNMSYSRSGGAECFRSKGLRDCQTFRGGRTPRPSAEVNGIGCQVYTQHPEE